MSDDSELEKMARRVLKKLLGGAHLERGADGDYAVLGGAGRTGKLSGPFVQAMRARGWLTGEGRLKLSDAGEGFLAREGADKFAAQHQLRRSKTITDPDGRARSVTFNAAESPLVWMHQRGIVGDVQCAAGERLRRDYTLAQLSPRLGVDFSAPVVFGRRAAKPGFALTETVIAAKQRFAKAMSAAGPGLSDILFDVCCHLNGLEHSERARGWPRASAKVVLQIALDRLAAHYGMTHAEPRRRIRAWAAKDETG